MDERPPRRSPSQESTFRALADLHSPLADLYEGARQILSLNNPIPGWGRLVPHAVREVVMRLPDVLAVPAEPRIEYSGRLDDIGREWQRHGLPVEDVRLLAEADGKITIPTEVVEKIAALIHDHEKSSQRTVRSKLLGIASELAPDTSPDAAKRWGHELFTVHAWAQKHTHERPTLSPLPQLAEYRHEFTRLENALAGILAEFGPNKESLDAILAETNRRAD